jgi:hypothetical protein
MKRLCSLLIVVAFGLWTTSASGQTVAPADDSTETKASQSPQWDEPWEALDRPHLSHVERLMRNLPMMVVATRPRPTDLPAAFDFKCDPATEADVDIETAVNNSFDLIGTWGLKYQKQSSCWMLNASLKGSADGNLFLGFDFLFGEPVKRDQRMAFKFIRASADQGDEQAAAYLSTMYLRGIGTKKDRGAARYWKRRLMMTKNGRDALDVCVPLLADVKPNASGGKS